MTSEKFMVNSDAGRMAAATYVSEEFARQNHLSAHDALRLRLLAEETLGMVRAMVDDFYGRIWFVGDDNAFEIHLEATAPMDSDKKHELLSVSSTGRNIAARGFMGMLGEVISDTLYHFGRVVDAYGQENMQYGMIAQTGIETPYTFDVTPVWTLQNYRAGLEDSRDSSADANVAWDELEKSIVANLADDVIVGVKGDCIELIIVKKLKK